MIDVEAPAQAPPGYHDAVAQVRRHRARPEVALEAAGSPQHIAAFALALDADVRGSADTDGDGGGDELATGRFVLLHEPQGEPTWRGSFRAVTFVRANLEPELAEDQLLGPVAWDWLREALLDAGVPLVAVGGTVTRVTSQSFGELAERPSSVQVEVRASWTVTAEQVGAGLAAWEAFLCTAAGLPPAR